MCAEMLLLFCSRIIRAGEKSWSLRCAGIFVAYEKECVGCDFFKLTVLVWWQYTVVWLDTGAPTLSYYPMQTVKLSIDFSRICVMERTTGLMVVPSVRKVSKSMPFTSHGQTGNREFINKLKSANISVIPHFCNKWLCSLPKLYMIYTCVKF